MQEICPILGFAIYVFCKYRLPIFYGEDQSKRYYKHLIKALKGVPADIEFGCRCEDIETHSSRKFAESTSCSKVNGSSRNQVCPRAGESLGKTQDCYVLLRSWRFISGQNCGSIKI
jgi:hypothetical protein